MRNLVTVELTLEDVDLAHVNKLLHYQDQAWEPKISFGPYSWPAKISGVRIEQGELSNLSKAARHAHWKKQQWLDKVRRLFPLGVGVAFKGAVVGTVCGYAAWLDEPEVLYTPSTITAPNRFGQFTVRSPHFRPVGDPPARDREGEE